MSKAPAIRYARTADGLDIAYWTVGRGRVLLHSPNVQLGHLVAEWTVRTMRRWYEALARSFMVARYDHRGGGLSVRPATSAPIRTIDALVRDIEAVADDVSTQPFVLLGWLAGSAPALAYAARYPERVSHLVLWNGFARDLDQGGAARMRSLFEMADTDWEMFTESICQAALGWNNADEARRWAEVARQASTQRAFLSYVRERHDWDVLPELSSIRAPTLVLYDPKNALANENRSRELAAGIRGAEFLLCGSDAAVPDAKALDVIRQFLGLEGSPPADLQELSPREREVLGLVLQGATNAEIAERLFISVNTVTRHLTHIYAKTGTRRRTELVRLALDRGFRLP